MLDDLDDGGGVEALQPLVAVHQRTVQELDPILLMHRQAVELEPVGGDLQRADRHIQADDLLELLVLDQLAKEIALAAAQVQDTFGAADRAGPPAPRRDAAR